MRGRHMTALTRKKVEQLMAEAKAIYCPQCSLTPGRENDRTGWDILKPWKRECFNCGCTWVDEDLRARLEKTAKAG